MQISDFPRLEDLSENGSSVTRGEPIERQIRISNPGNQRVEIDLWINATDENSAPLEKWCRYSEPDLLVLGAGTSRSITLTFEVPQQATPGVYNYEICIEAAAQFPGKAPLCRPQQLRVLSSSQDTRADTTPRFGVQPYTSSIEPYSLAAGQSLEITVQVENPSRRNERFHLICPDLEEKWEFKSYLTSYGLELSPGATGEIKASLLPPQYAPAGYYQPTLQLVSSNAKNLVLLDVVHLRILPDDRLQIELYPAIRRIPEEPKVFDITLINQGNIRRNLVIEANDQSGLFRYALDEPEVAIQPGQRHYMTLSVKPRRWWQRPLWGKGTQVAFEVESSNAAVQPVEPDLLTAPQRSLPAISPQFPALPQISAGTLVWQARPLRHLLLLALLILLALLGISLAIWRFLFWQPSLPSAPEIIRFGVPQKVNQDNSLADINYQAGNNTPVRLDWQVQNLSQIRRVSIVQLDGNTEVYRKSYNFNVLPAQLAEKQALSERIPIPPELQKNYPNGLEKKNNFCEVKPENVQKNKSSDSAFSQFVSFLSTPFKLLQGADDAPANETTLSCQGIITPARRAGDHVFRIEVFALNSQAQDPQNQSRWNRWFHPQSSSPNSEQPVATRVTDTISVAAPLPPPLLPVLLSFAATQAVYEEVGAVVPPTATSANSPSSPPRPAAGAIRLNWEIANPKQIQTLRLINLAPDGAVDRELKRFTVSNGIPTDLRQFCTLGSTLVCRNVPTGIQAVGAYKFKLVVVPKPPSGTKPQASQPSPNGTSQPPNAAEIALATPEIKIQARPPQIIQFVVNGQPVADRPKQVYVVNPARAPIDIQVYWEVVDGQAQLLPAPGTVGTTGNITFPVSSPAEETITLQVTNASGVQVTRSVVIQVQEFTPPERSQPNSPSQPTAPGTSPSPLLPSPPPNPNQLSPFELPPRPD